MEPNKTEQPKKYIRTFSGDIRTVKRGGNPDLVPLEEEKPAPIDNVELAPIKTYAGDFADHVKETHASTATILAVEQDIAPQFTPEKPNKVRLSSILYVIAGIVLLIIGITGSYIAYTRYLSAVTPITVEPSVQAPIFVDEREQISGNDKTLLRAIEQSTTRMLTAGTIRHLYIDPATTTGKSIFYELNLPAPSVLLRNINTENSMAGIVNPAPTSVIGTGGKQYPFFILSVDSYGDTFSGMLSWEPKMLRDLAAFFPPYPEAPAASVSSTTTKDSPQTATTSTKTQPAFYDEVVANHDVRVYRDANNRAIILYGYWNQTTLVIARDPAAFTEIVGRLATSRTKQ